MLRCITPKSPGLEAKPIKLTVALISRDELDQRIASQREIIVSNELGATTILALGSLDFSYINPPIVKGVLPAIAFSGSNMNVTVSGSNLFVYSGGTPECMWCFVNSNESMRRLSSDSAGVIHYSDIIAKTSAVSVANSEGSALKCPLPSHYITDSLLSSSISAAHLRVAIGVNGVLESF